MKICSECDEEVNPYGFTNEFIDVCKLCLIKRSIKKFTDRLENETILPFDSLNDGDVIVRVIGRRKSLLINKNSLLLAFESDEIFPIANDMVIVKTKLPTRHSSEYIVEIVKREHNYRCVYCGKSANSIDHVTPLVMGGSWRKENLLPSCKRCNFIKSDEVFSSLENARKYIRNRNKIRN